MGQYVDIEGVNTWFDEEGDGEPLILLHGGLCTNETWAAQMPSLAEHFRVLAPERRGHGHTADVDGPLTYTAMATDTIGFLDEVVGGPAHLVGWSDGAIVGLLVAEYRPDLVTKLVAISANFDPTGLVAEFLEAITHADPGGEGMSALRSLHQAHSPDGPEQWPILCRKFTEMITREPQMTIEELGRISAPTLVMVGDDDAVTLEHTLALYRAVPNAELAVLPGTSHMLPMEKPDLVNRIVLGFLQNEPVATRLPIRRAQVDADAH